MANILTDGQITRDHTNTIRGLACILLVSYHASIDALVYAGSSSEWLVALHGYLAPVRMPLFSFLSGVVYAARPIRAGEASSFLSGKVRRLIIPFIALTVIILVMKMVYPSSSAPASILDLPQHLLYGYSHLWFLQAIAIVFCIYAAADYMLPNRPKTVACIIVTIGLALYFSPVRQVNILSVGQAFLLLPFFALGVGISRWWGLIYSNRHIVLSVFVAGLSFGIMVGLRNGSLLSAPYSSAPSFTVGFCGVILLFLLTPESKLLSWIGGHSFTIFLFHSIFTALATRVGPSEPYPLIAFAFIVALLGPIAVDHFIDRYIPFLNWIIGKRARLRSGRPLAERT